MLLQQQCASLTAARPTADAVIVNYNLGIKEMFEEYGRDKDILFSKDYGGASIINAGDHSRWHAFAAVEAVGSLTFAHLRQSFLSMHSNQGLPKSSSVTMWTAFIALGISVRRSCIMCDLTTRRSAMPTDLSCTAVTDISSSTAL